MARDHLIQAALLGRWGESSSKPRRERRVRLREKTKATSELKRADRVAAEYGLYPAWLEKLWQVYENDLPTVADKLKQRKPLTDDDKNALLMHVAALRPRSTSFLGDLNQFQADNGLPPITVQDLPRERLLAFIRTIPYTTTWRWRVLRPGDNESFVINEQGLLEFSDRDWPGKGIFFPLGPTIGLLGFLHQEKLHRKMFRPADFSDDLTLNRGHAGILNKFSWTEATDFVIAQYDKQALIEALADDQEVDYDLSGPYRFRRFGWFGD